MVYRRPRDSRECGEHRSECSNAPKDHDRPTVDTNTHTLSSSLPTLPSMLLSRLASRRVVHPLSRTYATQLKGRSDILAKRPDDVVITFAKRTALGRAKKGQLKDVPVDELLHALFKVRALLSNSQGL